MRISTVTNIIIDISISHARDSKITFLEQLIHRDNEISYRFVFVAVVQVLLIEMSKWTDCMIREKKLI